MRCQVTDGDLLPLVCSYRAHGWLAFDLRNQDQSIQLFQLGQCALGDFIATRLLNIPFQSSSTLVGLSRSYLSINRPPIEKHSFCFLGNTSLAYSIHYTFLLPLA